MFLDSMGRPIHGYGLSQVLTDHGVHARIMPGQPRVAVLDLRERITKFGENVAVNRGAVLRVTHVPEEAEEWVMGKPAPPGSY
jgi:hypothetical protein